jgi:hypothetical protein
MRNHLITGGALLALAMTSTSAFAVGNGLPFTFREGFVGGGTDPHPVPADSIDGTYYSCVHFQDANSILESGFMWMSSFQDTDSVVGSQLNYFDVEGYRLYLNYRFQADRCDESGTCDNLPRASYSVNSGRLALWSDPLQDTTLTITECQVVIQNNADDVLLGSANDLTSGQKVETLAQAAGDFDLQWHDWAFTAAGQQLFRVGLNPFFAPHVVLDGNVTLLGGAINMDHNPEGSGNLYWVPPPQD